MRLVVAKNTILRVRDLDGLGRGCRYTMIDKDTPLEEYLEEIVGMIIYNLHDEGGSDIGDRVHNIMHKAVVRATIGILGNKMPKSVKIKALLNDFSDLLHTCLSNPLFTIEKKKQTRKAADGLMDVLKTLSKSAYKTRDSTPIEEAIKAAIKEIMEINA